MLKSGKVAIPFTRFTRVVPRSWAFWVTLPSFPITIVTWPENPGTPSPASFSAVISTAKGPDSTTGVAGGSIVKARCVAGGRHATLNVVRAVSFAATVTVRGLAPLTLQLAGTPALPRRPPLPAEPRQHLCRALSGAG